MASSVMAACELEFVGEAETRSMRSPVLTACEPAEAIVGQKRETNESNSRSEEEKRRVQMQALQVGAKRREKKNNVLPEELHSRQSPGCCKHKLVKNIVV